MRKLQKKSGFTLAECLVAIVVFAIMALLALTIVSASLRKHDENKQTSRSLIAQEEAIAADDTVPRTVGTGRITVTFNDPLAGTTLFDVNVITADEAVAGENKLEITKFTP